ncbi:MAG: glutamate-cysteine ligase family protein, partial [Pseudomonadota bacterium]
MRNDFPEALRGPRKIGREAEFPLVLPDGRAGETSRLWAPLLAEGGQKITYDDPVHPKTIVRIDLGRIGYEVEVGRATAEIVFPPADDLHELEALSEPAVTRLSRLAALRGMRVLGYGIQPRTRGSLALMTPKRRYDALHRAIGRPWLHFTTTASDQVQVDITRGELVDAINVMNLLSGPIIGLTANSPVYAGRVGQFVSGREGLLGGLGEHRHGMTPRRFTSVEDYVAFICAQRCYSLRNGNRFAPYSRSFTGYLAAHGSDYEMFLWHEHYTWNSARPRVKNATIEIRPACQQPPDEPLAAAALSLALVEAMPSVLTYVQDRVGSDPWPAMAGYRREVSRLGLRAPEPAPRFLAGIVDLCEEALRRRGRAEERFLLPIRRRLESRKLPAD